MIRGKAIFLLKRFSTKELRSLGDFVESPFHNKNREVIRLYRYLFKQAPRYDATSIERERVYKVVCGDGKFKQDKFYNLESQLVKLIEKYLLTRAFYEDEFMTAYFLLQSTFERSAEKNYNEIARKVQRKLDENHLSTIAYYQQVYLFEDIKNQKFLASNVRKADDSLQLASDNFDYFYLGQKLKYACEILSRNKLLKTSYKIKLYEEVKNHIAQNSYENIPFIHAYRLIFFILLEKNDEDYFFQLKKLLKEQSALFTKTTLDDLFSFALNYCFGMLQKKAAYVAEALDLYEIALENESLLKDNYLSPWHFKNIVALGINLKRYDWTENFIHTYKDKLPSEFMENAYHYNLAELFYAKQEWDKVLDYLNLVKFTDISYGVGTRLLQCKVYYKQKEIEVLLSLIISFKVYLKRQKGIAENIRISHDNFLYFLKQLLKEDINFPKLKQEIIAKVILTSKGWLLEALAEQEEERKGR